VGCTGEIELKGDGIGGIAVNIAARVAAIAGPTEPTAVARPWRRQLVFLPPKQLLAAIRR
jgi:hypothetical protein